MSMFEPIWCRLPLVVNPRLVLQDTLNDQIRVCRVRSLCSGVNESEDVVQDVEAAGLALELEGLCEAHGLILATKLKQC